MPKFSIIIPVYNVCDYIKRCLDSVFNQTYKNYEVIVINDGSTDGSMDIVNNYNVVCINNEHVGVSEARNLGVNIARGDYLIFLDSDDYWDSCLLENICKSLINNPDLVRFQVRTVNDQSICRDYNECSFYSKTGEEAFSIIANFHFVENVWCYAIKRDYYNKESFSFKKGTVHEDFGLTPLIIIKSKVVNCISYVGYNYYRRTGSIMNTVDYTFVKIKVNDFYNHYKFLISEIDKTELDSLIFKSFISNSLLLKITELKGADYKKYIKLVEEIGVYNNILADTFGRKIKKFMLRVSPKLFFRLKG
ncbi:MAG: glycosyltransferase [Bacilli bacterium]|nr:glycosyltransferase [Bacilli bacterium]